MNYIQPFPGPHTRNTHSNDIHSVGRIWEEVVESTRSLHVAGDIDDSQVFADSYLMWPTGGSTSMSSTQHSAHRTTLPGRDVMTALPLYFSASKPPPVSQSLGLLCRGCSTSPVFSSPHISPLLLILSCLLLLLLLLSSSSIPTARHPPWFPSLICFHLDARPPCLQC